MKITVLKEAPKIQQTLDAYKMYSSESLEIVHLHLLPGEAITLHKNPVDVIFTVLEGNADFEVEGETATLNCFDQLEIPANADRGVRNTQAADLRLLVIKKLK